MATKSSKTVKTDLLQPSPAMAAALALIGVTPEAFIEMGDDARWYTRARAWEAERKTMYAQAPVAAVDNLDKNTSDAKPGGAIFSPLTPAYEMTVLVDVVYPGRASTLKTLRLAQPNADFR